jgi:hypothetical protein
MCSIQKNKPSNSFYRLLTKKAHLLILVGLVFSHSLFSQQEIYLDNTAKDSISIKNMNGIELGHIGCYNIHVQSVSLHNIDETILTRNDFQLNYFHEFKLFPTIGLIAKGGFHLRPYRKAILDSGYNFLKFENMISGGVQLSLEPRWHIGYQPRYRNGKGALNSGWYLGLPMEAVNYYFINTSVVVFSITPSLGFRHAFSKKIFLEGSIGYYFSTLFLQTSQPTTSLKIAYCL